DYEYINWRSTSQIVKDYALPHRVALHRHAEATGLIAMRKSQFTSVLDSLIEQVEDVPVTGATILRAIRAYSCLTKNGDWIDLPGPRIVRRPSQPRPAASPAGLRKSNRNAAIRKPAKPMKTNAKTNS